MILVQAGYTSAETWDLSYPKFRLRALVARKRELERAAEQSFAVWEGEKFGRLMEDIEREIDGQLDFSCP